MYPPHHYPPMDRKSSNRSVQEAATQRKAAHDTQYFWDLVEKHMNGHNVAPRKLSKSQEEHMLFSKKAETAAQGVIDDSIPVQRSGPQSEEIQAIDSFQELQDKVPSSVLKCIELLRFDKPTPIQKHAIPLGLAGLDLMCCAQTGSGKTIAFLIPVITSINPIIAGSNGEGSQVGSEQQQPQNSPPRVSVDERGVLPKAVVLAPTRELASQIHLDARRLTFGSSIRCVCVYGGNDIRSQLAELCVGCELIVATPGRLNDLVDRGVVSLSQVNFLVLDEADRMLDMGFEPQIRKIVLDYDMPRGEDRQTFLFSATFPSEIQALARDFLRNYVWIAVGRVGSTVENIKQQVLLASADPNEKMKLLMSVLGHTDGRTLIFVQKKRTASWLCDCLRNAYGVTAEEIHGDRSQAQRENALKLFRDGHVRILVASDVAARGLDVPLVTHVIQFDMPLSAEDFDVYVHRIGRTGRAGMSGLATSFFVPGREVGEGNGKIAPLLFQLLKENNQDIPEWLQNSDDLHSHHHGSNNRRFAPNNQGGGYSHNGRSPAPQHRFGFHDTRMNQQNVTYQSNHQQHYQYENQRGYTQAPRNGYNGNGTANNGYGNTVQSQHNMNRPPTQQNYPPRQMAQHQQLPPQSAPAPPTMTTPTQPAHVPPAYNVHPHPTYYPSQQYPGVAAVPPSTAAPAVTAPAYSVPPPAATVPPMVAPVTSQQHQAPATYPIPAPPSMMTPHVPPTTPPYQPTGGYYDPYSGTYIPNPASVEALTNQFGAMNMQQPPQQQWLPPNPSGMSVGQMHHPQNHMEDRNRRPQYGHHTGNQPGRGGMYQQSRPNPQHPPQMTPPNMMNYQQVDNRMYSNGGRSQYGSTGAHSSAPYGRSQYSHEQVAYPPPYENRGGTTYYQTDGAVSKMNEVPKGDEPIVSDA